MSIFHRIKLRKQLKDHANRPLNISEILSRSDKTNVVVDAYTYFMRQSNWEIDDRFNEKIRIFLLCVLFDGEVANGGISQFLPTAAEITPLRQPMPYMPSAHLSLRRC